MPDAKCYKHLQRTVPLPCYGFDTGGKKVLTGPLQLERGQLQETGPCTFVSKGKPTRGGGEMCSGKGCWYSLTLAQEDVKA